MAKEENEVQKNAVSLLDEILKLPGDKKVTLVGPETHFEVDIDTKGEIGYQPGIKVLFLAKLYRVLIEGGGMIIRQFLPLRVKRKVANGKNMWIPEKNLYAVLLENHQWVGCTKEQVKDSCEIDAGTGERLPKEEGVHYQDFAKAYTDV